MISNTGFAPIPKALKPFRFQAAWILHERFEEFMYTNWKNDVPLIPFLKCFASSLRDWNKNIFHNIFKKKYELWARLEGVQRSLNNGGPSRLVALEDKLKVEMENVLAQEELLWFQKSRQSAIRDDRNTRYFHLSTFI